MQEDPRTGRLTVSVVIPTYNRSADVLRAVGSVLAQTLPAFEILVVDDGSTDNTAEVVQALPAPVRYLRKPNGGVSSARNLGLREARGEVVALLDSDDQWEPEWLERAVRALADDPACGAVTAERRSVDPAGRRLGVSNMQAVASGGLLPLPVLFTHYLGPNLCIRRKVIDVVGGYDESLATGEDVDMTLRVAAVAGVRLVAEPLILVTKTPDSLSGRINTGNRLRVFDKFEKLHPALAARHAAELRIARATAAYSYALDLTVARRLPEARARAVESWRYVPSMLAAKQVAKVAVLQLLGRGRA